LIAAAGAALESEGKAVEKEGPVGQSGEHVEEGVKLDTLFGLLAIGDVAEAEDVANVCGVDAQRSCDEGDIEEFAVFGGADGLSGDTASDVDFPF